MHLRRAAFLIFVLWLWAMGREPWALSGALCKRTGALGVKRREASVRRHAKLGGIML